MAISNAQAIRLGGREWTGRNGTTRVYLDNSVWAPMVGLDVTRYRSGNVQGATLRGAPLSNARAGQVLATRVYVQNGELHVEPGHARVSDITDGIASAVNARVAQMDAPKAASIATGRMSGS